jgi:hypothetical protein
MAIHINEITTVLNLNQKTHSQLETVILKYGGLVQKMNNMEQQSWLFKKAVENNLIKINSLKSEFDKIKTEVNTSGIDDLIVSLNDYKEQFKSIQIHFQSGFIKGLAVASFNSKIIYIEELLTIKSRVDEMKEIEYYLENRKHLIKLLGW